jgi:hypothetical protein
LWCTGSSFSLPRFLFKPKQRPFSASVIVFGFEVHDGADPGEGVGQHSEQGAVTQVLCVEVSIASRSFWTSLSTNAGVLPFVRENVSVLISRAGFMVKIPFWVSQENSIRIAAMCRFTVGGAASRCKGLDVGRYRDGFNVFKAGYPARSTPGEELLNRPVIGGSCVRVADRDRKKLEKLFAG